MARDPKLSELFETIHIDEDEVTRYRRNLADSLEAGTQPNRRSLWSIVAIAAVALLAVFLWQRSQSVMDMDPSMTLAELMDMREHYSSEQLLAYSQREWQDSDGLTKFNAGVLLTSMVPNEQAIEAAREGIKADHRPEFRAYFLEFLLDHADELAWNAIEIERLLDQEDDPLCIKLYRYLLRLSS